RVWNVAEADTRDVDLLHALSQPLGGSATSRLDKPLVHGDEPAASGSTFVGEPQPGSNFMVMANGEAGAAPEALAAISEGESAGPTSGELEQAKAVIRAGFIRGIERVGGSGGEADVLAACEVCADDPGCFQETLDNIAAATPADIQAMGARWLGDGDHTIVV